MLLKCPICNKEHLLGFQTDEYQEYESFMVNERLKRGDWIYMPPDDYEEKLDGLAICFETDSEKDRFIRGTVIIKGGIFRSVDNVKKDNLEKQQDSSSQV